MFSLIFIHNPFPTCHVCFITLSLLFLLPDFSVSVADIPLSGRPALLSHLRQVLPGLQRGAGICRLDLVRDLSHTKDSRQPPQTPSLLQTGWRTFLYIPFVGVCAT